MRLLYQTHPRTLALQGDTHTLLFRHLTGALSRCAVELVDNEAFETKPFKPLLKAPVYGFLGLITVNKETFLLVITGKVDVASPMPKETVHKIYGVEFVSVTHAKWDHITLDSAGYPIMAIQDSETVDYAERTPHPCFEMRKLLTNGSFLYAADFDVTSPLMHRGVGSAHSLDNYQEEFMWNSFMMHGMLKFRSDLEDEPRQAVDANGFFTTVIRGFAETFQTTLKGLKCLVTMISKQSWKRAGTRFNARGIDDEGHVANFVETEFILYTNRVLYAFTEIRGSVPIFWEQDTTLITPKVTITRSVEATQPVFDKHFARLTEKYGPVHIINLLSTRSSEIGLTQRYAEHFRAYAGLDVSLCAFDFHQETAKNGYSHATRILPLIQDSLFEKGYFSYDLVTNKVASQQAGVFRTNCLDCLDRTNLIQQVLSTACLNMFFQDHQVRNADQDLFTKHGTLWADHGDQISQIYTGTNALKSSFTRNGKMSLAGALSDMTKSVSRMYINNFVDKGTQVTIDTVLGRNANQEPVALYDPIADHVAQSLAQAEGEFTSYDTATVFTGTYNVNGLATADDLTEWLFPSANSSLPDMYVLGLQEIIPLTAGNFISATPSLSNSAYWENLVGETLNNQAKYTLLRTETMVSMAILLYVKADKLANVTQVEGSSKKTGLGGMGGNKGGCAIRLTYGETTFCFVNCHLSAGVTAVDERANDYESILQGLRFTRNRKIGTHEAVIWLGDLNYRIDLENAEVRERVGQSDWRLLMGHDQLKREMNTRGGAFKGFLEREITFAPTYKYDRGTSVYDSSEKQRVPSWTDRILFRGKGLLQLNYSCVMEVRFSDHKPVYGTFACEVKFVNHATRNAMAKALYNQFKLKKTDSLSLLDGGNQSQSVSSTPSSSTLSTSLIDIDDAASLPLREGTPPVLPKRQPLSAPVLQPTVRGSLPLALSAGAGGKGPLGSAKALYGVSRSAPMEPSLRSLPAPPAPRRNATTTPVSASPVAPPAAPAPRKSTVPPILTAQKLPPGFSSVPLQAKPRSNTPTPTPAPPPPPRRSTMAPTPAPQVLARSTTTEEAVQSEVRIAPPKPKKPTNLVVALSEPPPMSVNDWKPLVPK